MVPLRFLEAIAPQARGESRASPFAATNIRGEEMCVVITSFPLGEATNIRGVEMCVITTSFLLGEATNIRGVEMCVMTTSFPLG